MQMKQQLATEWKSLQDEAQLLVRAYWDKALRANDAGPYSERNKYGVRVRRRKTTISIEWFLNVLSGPSWERRHRAFYVSRGKGYAYPLSRFSKSTATWEKQAIAEFEAAAGPLRQRAELLMRIKRLVDKYDSLCRPAGTPSHLDGDNPANVTPATLRVTQSVFDSKNDKTSDERGT